MSSRAGLEVSFVVSSSGLEFPYSKEDPFTLFYFLDHIYAELTESGYVYSVFREFPDHLEILQHAARDFFYNKPYGSQDSRRRLKPSWKNLFAILFHEYFRRMRRYEAPMAYDPLVDALLLIIDTEDVESLSRRPRYCCMLKLVLRCIGDGIHSPYTSSNSSLVFLNKLRSQWMYHKRMQLVVLTESLMPWSTVSQEEGSLDGPVPAQDIGCIHLKLVKLAYASPPVIPIPDMPWLGAKHDGYPRSSSLTSYVTARWLPSFTPFDNAALWQAAMTFGVLEAITNLSIPSSLLLETRPDGDVVFTARSLNVLAFHWTFALQNDRTPSKRIIHHSFDTIFRAHKSLAQVEFFHDEDVVGGLWKRSKAEVSNILSILSIFVRQFWTCIHMHPIHKAVLGNKVADFVTSSACGLPQDLFYHRKMLKDGWCPFLLFGFVMAAEPFLWLYMSSRRPFFRKSRDEHRQCTHHGGCTIHNIDETTYQTCHTQPRCSCPLISPSIADVKTLLSESHYPVMSYDETTGGLTTHSEDEGPYVAISHVWIDGLGSSTESGLPICQIKRIHEYARKLLPDCRPAFWIDGLCIPEEQGSRKMAIRKMGDTYRNADKVLVFDNSIRALCSRERPVEENVLRISMSPWMQRVWTLQEALLAKELHFEFADGIVPAQDLTRALDEDNTSLGFTTIRFLIRRVLPIGAIIKCREQTYNFENIVSLLAHRMTSKPSDEPIAIAGLLNVDTKKLDIDGRTDLQSRLQALFLEVKTFTPQLLWRNFARMEQSPGFRWAPTSLASVGRVIGSRHPPYGKAVCSSQGLTMEHITPVLYFADVHIAGDTYDPIFINDPPRAALYHVADTLHPPPYGPYVQCDSLS